MPIVTPPRPDAPLGQGDILKGVKLFATKEGWLAVGGEAAKAPFPMCLVVSRPCNVAHKPQVIVAGVNKYPESVPKEIDSFEKVFHFLTGARDGGAAPDVFYLGQLPEMAGRYCARLDSLFSIQLPEDPAERQRFVAERRVASLNLDFARDFHVRLFNAFASLGFDDYQWPSTEDLEWLVNQGRADLAAAEQAVHKLKADKASLTAEGKQFSEPQLEKAEKRLNELRERVTPFEEEFKRRRAD